MTTSNSRPSDLDHDLQVHFADLARFDSTLQCESSALYGSLKPEIDRVLGGVDQDDLRCADGAGDVESPIRAVAWNLERGIRLDGIIDALRTDLRLASGAVYLLTEIDYGMARAANRHVAREIAQALGLAYVFAEYVFRQRTAANIPKTDEKYPCCHCITFPGECFTLGTPYYQCHPERSEGSLAAAIEMLHFVQHDMRAGFEHACYEPDTLPLYY